MGAEDWDAQVLENKERLRKTRDSTQRRTKKVLKHLRGAATSRQSFKEKIRLELSGVNSPPPLRSMIIEANPTSISVVLFLSSSN